MGASIDPTQPGALAALRAGAGQSAASVPVMLSLASHAISVSSHELARDILVGAALIDPTRAETWALLGAVYEQLEDLEKAERSYELSLGLDEDNPSIAFAWARLMAARGADEAALSLLNWIISVTRDAPRVFRHAAQLRTELMAKKQGAA